MFTLLKLAFSGVLSWVGKIAKFIVARPKLLCLVIGLAVGSVVAWYWTSNHFGAKIQAMEGRLRKAKQDAEDTTRILKEESRIVQDKLEQDVMTLRENLKLAEKSYLNSLEEAKRSEKIKYVKVRVPIEGPTQEVDVMFEGNKQVCRSFPSSFTDEVNRNLTQSDEVLK